MESKKETCYCTYAQVQEDDICCVCVYDGALCRYAYHTSALLRRTTKAAENRVLCVLSSFSNNLIL